MLNAVSVHHPLLSRFDESVDGIRGWLEQVDLDLKKEPVLGVESPQGVPDSTEELERIENLHKELLSRRLVCMRNTMQGCVAFFARAVPFSVHAVVHTFVHVLFCVYAGGNLNRIGAAFPKCPLTFTL